MQKSTKDQSIRIRLQSMGVRLRSLEERGQTALAIQLSLVRPASLRNNHRAKSER